MGTDTDSGVIDIHHHVGAAPALSDGESSDGEGWIESDLEIRLAYMDRFGVEKAVLMPTSGALSPNGFADRCHQNTLVAQYRDKEPDRFVALGTVSPADGLVALDEIDRCVNELGMKGISWHHRFLGVPINHALMDAFLERLATYGLPAFIHIIADSTLEAPWKLEMLADRFPETQFVALDAFSSTDQAHWMPYLASKHPNVCFDTAVLVSVGHQLDHFIKTVGSDRLCFGSNFYSKPKLFGTPVGLSEVRELGLPSEDEAKILGGNARRILGL